MSVNYFKNNYGPILESDMPFENNMNLIPLSSVQNKTPAAGPSIRGSPFLNSWAMTTRAS